MENAQSPLVADVDDSPSHDVPSSPINHYLQMVGLNKDDISDSADMPVNDDHLIPIMGTDNFVDTDPLNDHLHMDMGHDAFENPLDDDPEKQDDQHVAVHDHHVDNLQTVVEDDSHLHDALSNTHNQG